MSVLVYIESENNKFKKSSYEALCYGRALADSIGKKVCGVVINCSNTENLNSYGADKIININIIHYNPLKPIIIKAKTTGFNNMKHHIKTGTKPYYCCCILWYIWFIESYANHYQPNYVSF